MDGACCCVVVLRPSRPHSIYTNFFRNSSDLILTTQTFSSNSSATDSKNYVRRGYPNDLVCLVERNQRGAVRVRHPCTHAKSISSIFASKTAVTSPATKLRTHVKITCTCIFASKTFGSSPSENRRSCPCAVGGGANRRGSPVLRPLPPRGWRPRPAWRPWRRPGGLSPGRPPLRRACP